MQYIQNTINKAEIEKIKNNHKGIDAERHQRAIIDMSKGVGMYVWTPYLESQDIPNPSIEYLRVAIDNNRLN